MADKYAVNYEDERFKNVENEKNTQLQETTNRYDTMINNTDTFYQNQINASKEWANKQSELQQAQTDLAIDKINQQKETAEKDYRKEQKASYVDYVKQIDPFSVDAEKMAANGLHNSGYSESSRISMWNTYQNRYATARENYNNALLNYDNGIREAQLANNSALAQIAYDALKNELELSLQGFQYKNELLQQKEAQLQNINNTYYARYQDVLAQINAEIERQRQQDEWEESNRQWWQDFNLRKQQYAIENERAERQLQAALANEGSYVVNEGTIEDAVVENNSNEVNLGALAGVAAAIASNTSKSNQSILSNTETQKLIKMGRSNSKISQKLAEKALTKALAEGKITQAEANIIVNEMNK